MTSFGIRFAVMCALALAGCANKGGESPKKPADPASKKAGAAKADPAKAAKPTTAADPGGPLAEVNGIALSRAEFDKKYSKMTKAFTTRKKEIPAGLAKRYKESILKQLVEKELLRQKIKEGGITVADADLGKELEDYKKMFRTEENFQRYLKSSSITLDQIKGNLAHNLSVEKLLEKQGQLSVTPEEVQAYFEKNKKRYELKEQIRASHILFKVPKKPAKKGEAAEQKKAEAEFAKAGAAAKKKADEVYKEAAKKGADFGALAKKHSQGPTAPRGGDLSYFNRGRMVPEFEKTAFEMKVGDISKPVKTQFGWHIIKVTDKKEGRQRPFAEVQESITKLLRNKKSRRAKADLLKGLRESAKIVTHLPGIDLNKKPAKPSKKAVPLNAPAPKGAKAVATPKGAKAAPAPKAP